MKALFGVTSKKGLWAPFFEVKTTLGTIFAQIFRDCARIFDKSKLLGVHLEPLHPPPLTRLIIAAALLLLLIWLSSGRIPEKMCQFANRNFFANEISGLNQAVF